MSLFQAEQLRAHVAQGTQDPHVGVVVLVHPEAGEANGAFYDGQAEWGILLVHVPDQVVGVLPGSDDQGPVGLRQLVDGLQAVPCPGLDALAHGVIDVDGDVDLRWLVPGKGLFQFFRVVRNDGELFRRDAVALGRVSVATKSGAYFALFPGGEDYGAHDVAGEGLLENTPVHHLHSYCAHMVFPP